MRQALIEAPETRRGTDYRVEVREQTRHSFDRSLLPPEILDDPGYWRESVSQVVTVKRRVDETTESSLIDDEDT